VVKGTTITSADGGSVQDQTVYGQGKAYIRISPFDNYYKFTFYKQGADGNTQLIDLQSSGTFYMVFINNSNKKVSAPSIDDKNIANSSKGELAFKVSETLSTDVLQYNNRTYTITNRPPASGDPNIFMDQIPTNGAANIALATRATALNDSIRDTVISVQRADQNLLAGTLTISSNSSSVLYYGSWLKVDEPVPSPVTPSPVTPSPVTPVLINSITGEVVTGTVNAVSSDPNVSFVTAPIGNNILNTLPQSPSIGKIEITGPELISTTGQKLTTTELKSAISIAVGSMLANGMGAQYIINYFLNPQSSGYKLYVGITKEIFTDSVKGIFSDADLTILNNYGNTNAGQTNGGSASNQGSTGNQTGGDSGSKKPAGEL
jgi:hypothetical protein